MLGQLHIKNIGIIEDVVINFEDGFNVLTGETGAGKSLIIGSIGAVTGSRISKELIKTGKESALIEACFFEGEDTVILSREIFSNGRNICKINGEMTTLANLKEMGEKLIDIHGQHDNQSLLNPAMHIDLLDNFIGKELANVKALYLDNLHEYKRLVNELNSNFGDEKERTRRIDLLKYQINEIENADLKVGEEEELYTRRTLIINSEKIVSSLSNAYCSLNDIVIDNLGSAVHEISNIASLDDKYDKILLNLNEAFYMLKDSASETLECMNNVDFDRNEQNEIEERLDLISNLKRKIENCETELKNMASKMSEIRKKYAITISKKINKELQDLEMKNAKIEFEFKQSESFLENGMDNVQILISTNLGEDMKPLSKIASGGEISRIMLALKTVFCEYDDIDSMIFDEIDTGISGQAAKMVAEKMKKISKKHQLICITHLPVIAAMGDANYFISKVTKDNKTCTLVKKLNEDETITEIARILDGNDICEISLKHAMSLRKVHA